MNELAGTRRRYATFDAMRGVAALVVVVGHFDEVMGIDPPSCFFLAVDLFFLLSGFVLALNYDRRFAEGMTALQFMRLRAIRLWPLVAIGALVGLINQLDYGSPLGPQLHSFVSFVLTCFALPSWPRHAPYLLFPLNTVFWTLMFEFWVANLVFAVFWRRLQGVGLWLVIAVGLAGVVAGERVYHDLAIGWGWTNGWVGLARVLWSFFLGVALGRRFPTGFASLRLPSWLCVVDVLAIFCVPVPARFSGMAGLLHVVLLLPLVVVLGAGAQERRPRLGAVLGDASYAVYAIHYPLIVELSVLVTPAMINPAVHGSWRQYAILTVFLAAVALLALAIDRFVDRPARRWLTARFSG